jgi:hypothetical protein
MLRSESRGLTNSNEDVMKVKNSRTGRVAHVIEISVNPQPPRTGSPCRSIDSGRSRVSLQCHNYPQPPTLPIEYTVRGVMQTITSHNHFLKDQ